MIISKIGTNHIQKMCNNQDYYLSTDRLKLITDGCSAGKDNDFGTRLFCKLFSLLDNKDNVYEFEKNVEKVFKKIFNIFTLKTMSKMEKEDFEFMINNLSFTILACFEMDTKFVVKFLGDGYIITENIHGNISYNKINYGDYPPYYIYNYMNENQKSQYKHKLKFKTYEFDKSMFTRVGLASDGIEPIVFGSEIDKRKFDGFLTNKLNLDEVRNTNQVANIISRNSNCFYDDVTILF